MSSFLAIPFSPMLKVQFLSDIRPPKFIEDNLPCPTISAKQLMLVPVLGKAMKAHPECQVLPDYSVPFEVKDDETVYFYVFDIKNPRIVHAFKLYEEQEKEDV